MGFFSWTSVGIGSILRMTVLLIRKKLKNIKRGISCLMLILRFLLVKQYLFCLANFKIFGTRNVSSPVPFLSANMLSSFVKQYREFSLTKRFLRYVRKISRGSLVNTSPYLRINIDYLTARLPDAEMAKTLLAANQQSWNSLHQVQKTQKSAVILEIILLL